MSNKTPLTCLLIALLLGACTRPAPTTSETAEYLDEATGTRVVHLNEPAVFFRDAPMLAVHARDYVSLAPMELSQAGRRDYLLWVWQWSTIDRGVQTAEVSRMVLLLDGEPMELRAGRPRTLGQWPYAAPVNGGRMALYTLTPSQLAGLARAEEIHVFIESSDTTGDYQPWRADRAELGQFAQGVAARQAAAMARVND